jgi:hypothetical protein
MTTTFILSEAQESTVLGVLQLHSVVYETNIVQ